MLSQVGADGSWGYGGVQGQRLEVDPQVNVELMTGKSQADQSSWVDPQEEEPGG